MIDVKHETHFTINGWLVDLTLIEHWGRHQGAGKFHRIRAALHILRNFTKTVLTSEDQLVSLDQAGQVLQALQQLAEFGYHIPENIFTSACQQSACQQSARN